MKNKGGLSVGLNMATGFVPVIIAILFSEFLSIDQAIYIGTAIGILLAVLQYIARKPLGISPILASNTAILLALSITTFVWKAREAWLQQSFPFVLEIVVMIPLLILFMNRKRYYINSYKNKTADEIKDQFNIIVPTFSSIRTFLKLATAHFALITIGLVIARSSDNGYMWFMLHVAPTIVLVLCVIAAHIETAILQTLPPPNFIPVVTPQGGVVGRVDQKQASEYKNGHTHPVVRIAFVSHDMLFLARRSTQWLVENVDKGKVDIPLETYLVFKEDISSGVERLLRTAFPEDWQRLNPEFSVKYKFKNEETDRIVYLYVVDLGTEDDILNSTKFENGKLWTFQQIEYNLGQNYFSELFENEYDHLKMIIETRGIYKES